MTEFPGTRAFGNTDKAAEAGQQSSAIWEIQVII